MFWFKERKKRMEFIQSFIPTSKAQLIQVAMWYHKGDVQKAQEFVDFYTKNMELPDFDPVAPSFVEQVKSSATGLFAWLKENQGDLVQGWQFVQGIIKNRGVMTTALDSAGAAAEALPPINE